VANFITELFKSEKEPITEANSKGAKEDYETAFPSRPQQQSPFFGETPDFSIEKARELYKEDPVVRAAVQKTVNKVLTGGYRLEPKNGKSGIKNLRQKINDRSDAGLDFEKHLEEVVGNLVLYNNAFIEVREVGGEKYVNLLEPEFMEIRTAVNGDVKFYYQDVDIGDLTDEVDTRPTWQPEEVVHIKQAHYTTNAWSPVDLEAVYETLLIKDYVRGWIRWFMETHQMRPHVNVDENTSDKDIKNMLDDLENMRHQVDHPFPTQGDTQIEKLQSYASEAESLHDLLTWCDDQLLMLMQVPPVLLGDNNDTSKGIATEMRKQFNDYVKSIQRTVSRYEERELFPKLGAPSVALKWGEADATAHKEIMETVRSMRQAQMTSDAIEEYLEMRGMAFETDQVFKTDEQLARMNNKDLGTGNEGIKGNESADTAQSRERQSENDMQRQSQQAGQDATE